MAKSEATQTNYNSLPKDSRSVLDFMHAHASGIMSSVFFMEQGTFL